MYEFKQDLPGEIWGVISNTNNRYEISSLGRVKSLWRIKYKGISYKPLILEPQVDKQGYHRITINIIINGESIPKEFFVHRLVATEFISNPEHKLTVNHIDGDKSNNCVSNLEWTTQSENNKHAYLTGLNSNHSEYNTQKKIVMCVETKETWESLAQASYSAGFKYPGGLQYYIHRNRPYKNKHYRYLDVEFENKTKQLKENDLCKSGE